MAAPLFTTAENAAYIQQRKALDKRYHDKELESTDYWKELDRLSGALKVMRVRRAQERIDEFLNALIVIAGSRGGLYLDFDLVFEKSDSDEMRQYLVQYDTPEARRTLYTILRALTEVPRSWGASAFLRFFRGIGKQRDLRYHGAGFFGVQYGWKAAEVFALCRDIVCNSFFSEVLIQYADAAQEVQAARDADPDYEIIDYSVEFKAVRFERDVEFINKLCDLLEKKGLAPVPAPKEQKPRLPRKQKIFKPGDVIRYRDLRDLPLPAYVRIPVLREDPKMPQPFNDAIEEVVVQLRDGGSYQYYSVGPDKKAYANARHGVDWRNKSWLDGAVYLGVWESEVVKNKELKRNFRFWKPTKPTKKAL